MVVVVVVVVVVVEVVKMVANFFGGTSIITYVHYLSLKWAKYCVSVILKNAFQTANRQTDRPINEWTDVPTVDVIVVIDMNIVSIC